MLDGGLSSDDPQWERLRYDIDRYTSACEIMDWYTFAAEMLDSQRADWILWRDRYIELASQQHPRLPGRLRDTWNFDEVSPLDLT